METTCFAERNEYHDAFARCLRVVLGTAHPLMATVEQLALDNMSSGARRALEVRLASKDFALAHKCLPNQSPVLT